MLMANVEKYFGAMHTPYAYVMNDSTYAFYLAKIIYI